MGHIVRINSSGDREVIDTSTRKYQSARNGFVPNAVAAGVSHIDQRVAYLSARLREAQKQATLAASKGGHVTYHDEEVRKLQMQLSQLEETREFAMQRADVMATQETERDANRPAVSVAPIKITKS